MIERLQRVLARIEQLPLEVQEEVAAQLEVLTEPFEETLSTETSPLLEGRKSLELISALYESIETGHEVALRFTPRLSRLGVAS